MKKVLCPALESVKAGISIITNLFFLVNFTMSLRIFRPFGHDNTSFFTIYFNLVYTYNDFYIPVNLYDNEKNIKFSNVLLFPDKIKPDKLFRTF